MENKNWINKLDELEGDQSGGANHNPGRRRKTVLGYSPEQLYPSIAIGGGVILLVILVMLFARGGDDTVPAQEVEEITSRLENMEERLEVIEAREEERQRALAEFMDTSQDLKRQVDRHRENIDDMRQQLAALEEDVEAATREAPADPAQEEVAEPDPEPARDEDEIYHEVQSGENLFRIGLEYDVSAEEIREWNDLGPDDAIYPGQELLIRQ